MRFDTTELATLTEICAYGTVGVPVTDGREVHRPAAGLRRRKLDPMVRMLM